MSSWKARKPRRVPGGYDHGPGTTAKRTLMDSIRSTNVAGGRGGRHTRTSAIQGCHSRIRRLPGYGREIVFLDTPGHEALRHAFARGEATDIVGLVTGPMTALCRRRGSDTMPTQLRFPIMVAVN